MNSDRKHDNLMAAAILEAVLYNLAATGRITALCR